MEGIITAHQHPRSLSFEDWTSWGWTHSFYHSSPSPSLSYSAALDPPALHHWSLLSCIHLSHSLAAALSSPWTSAHFAFLFWVDVWILLQLSQLSKVCSDPHLSHLRLSDYCFLLLWLAPASQPCRSCQACQFLETVVALVRAANRWGRKSHLEDVWSGQLLLEWPC